MSIASVSDTNSVNTNQSYGLPDDGFQYLNGDALIQYCEARLRGLDSDIKFGMDEQRAGLARRKAIQDATQVFKSFTDRGPTSIVDWDKCQSAVNNAISQLPPGDPGIAQLQAFSVTVFKQYQEGDHLRSPHDGEWKGTVDGLNNLCDDIKSDSEIDMLKLQQLMSQRQTAVQSTTNMVSTIDQTMAAIVKNI